MAAQLPSNEAARLEALRQYEILDTGSEVPYDNIAKLAAFICGTPIALAVLVDEHRQWFKARVGLDVSETPRDVAFCAHAILTPDLFVVEDAHQDNRFHDNPLVMAGPRVRFYAGAPLIDSEGFALGTLCVIDKAPRHLEPGQLEALKMLGEQVVALMEKRRVMNSLAAALRNLEELRSLIPMCAWCKQVRDDDGDWHSIDQYVSRTTGKEITHGMCPTCYQVQISRAQG